ncbi:MAG: GNAT family N-acetyltransferase [Methylococcaceae bacterium]|jgi:ribosomal protein S18 acetylase RimI-like enzyme
MDYRTQPNLAKATGPELSFCRAQADDAEAMVALINAAYRGESSKQGWTTEADLLEGRRTDMAEISQILNDADSMFLLCKADQELLGTIYLHNDLHHIQISMLAVTPGQQGLGIGRQLLCAAEDIAYKTWNIRKFVMAVIPLRQELIAFYERRGYQRTGNIVAFPINPVMWTPKVDGLSLEMLEKII